MNTDLQKAQIDAREEGCPEKREAKNGLIAPDDQTDDRRDAHGDCKFIHVDFLKNFGSVRLFEFRT